VGVIASFPPVRGCKRDEVETRKDDFEVQYTQESRKCSARDRKEGSAAHFRALNDPTSPPPLSMHTKETNNADRERVDVWSLERNNPLGVSMSVIFSALNFINVNALVFVAPKE